MVLWRPTRPSTNNTPKRCPFHYRGLKCKSRKSRDTWNNRQNWPWSIKWSRAKANRVLPRECTGDSKHPLPMTQKKTIHLDITRWSIPKSDWSHSLQSKMEKLWHSVQFSSVTQSCLTLCYHMDCSMPGLPVYHQLPEFTQTHVHRVADAIQPPHPLLSPFPPAFNLSQHQGLFQWVSSLHQVAKVLEFELQRQSFQWTLRTNLL